MSELAHIEIVLNSSREIAPNRPRLVCGDFNALTLEDYSEAELAEVARVRANNAWEEPKNKVSTIMKGRMGFADSKALSPTFSAGRLSTCRFNTRIDYVYVDGGSVADGAVSVSDYYHVDDRASDHNMVVAEVVFDTERLRRVAEKAKAD